MYLLTDPPKKKILEPPLAISNNLKANPIVKQLLFIFKKITTAKLITKKNLISHNCLS